MARRQWGELLGGRERTDDGLLVVRVARFAAASGRARRPDTRRRPRGDRAHGARAGSRCRREIHPDLGARFEQRALSRLRPRADQRLHRLGEAVDAQVEHREQAPDDARRLRAVPVVRRLGIDPHAAVEVRRRCGAASTMPGVGDVRRGSMLPYGSSSSAGCIAASPTTTHLPARVEAAQHVAGRHRVGAQHARASCRRGRRRSCGSSTPRSSRSPRSSCSAVSSRLTGS